MDRAVQWILNTPCLTEKTKQRLVSEWDCYELAKKQKGLKIIVQHESTLIHLGRKLKLQKQQVSIQKQKLNVAAHETSHLQEISEAEKDLVQAIETL